MATWVNIANSNLQPGAPARSVDALALRDNPIAIAEGAAGAPRITTAALDPGAVTGPKLGSEAVTWDKVAPGTLTWDRMNAASIYAGIGAADNGGIGTYAMVARSAAAVGSIVWGNVVAGSLLVPSNSLAENALAAGPTLAGAWRIMGSSLPIPGGANAATLALRVA